MSQVASLTMAHDALLPSAPGGNGAGAALALVVHGALLLALTTSVDWRSKTPDAVSAELWASVPQVAAPAPVEPAPAPQPVPALTPPPQAAPRPPEPDIAFERAERRKAEAARKRAEADADAERLRLAAADKKRADDEARKKREQADLREARAEDERLARQREENLRRIMGQAGAAGTGPAHSTGTAAQDAAPSAAYVGKLAARIRRESVFTGSVPDNAAAEVEVRAAPGGTIISRRLVKSSGHKEWDEAVLRAIDKTGRLPPDTDGRVPTWLTIVFRPQE